MQLDFVEMLRVRDEKRRMRHVETLRRQKEEEEDEAEATGGGARVEILGDLDEEQGSAFPPVKSPSKPQVPKKNASYSPSGSTDSTGITNRQVRLESLDIFSGAFCLFIFKPSGLQRTTKDNWGDLRLKYLLLNEKYWTNVAFGLMVAHCIESE